MTNNNKLTKENKELESLRNQVKYLEKNIAKERKQLDADKAKEAKGNSQ
jgi:predicted  nucleic acid-binding Zn-ribbon protein